MVLFFIAGATLSVTANVNEFFYSCDQFVY